MLAGEGTPIDDHRASAAYRSAMLGTVAPQALRPDREREVARHERRSARRFRPTNAVVGQAIPHESAALHVTGRALYTDDLVAARPGVLHAWPGAGAHAHARVTGLRTAPALRRAGRGPGAHRRRRARRQRRRRQARRAALPVRGHVPRTRRLLGARRDARGGPPGAGRVEVDYEPLPALITVHEAIAAESFQGARPTVERGDVDAGLARGPRLRG